MSDEDKKVEETKKDEKPKEVKEVTPSGEEVKEVEKSAEGEKSEKGESKEEAAEAEVVPQESEKSMEAEREEKAKEEVIPEAEDLKKAEAEEVKQPHTDLEPGMIVRVHEKIKDVSAKGQERERVQVFEGLIIGMKGKDISRTMTVRKNTSGWMVEKIFPLSSPNLEKVEVVKKFRTRRAKLSYLRDKFKRKLKEVKEVK